jgi:single-strand DNA-binding protein
MANLNRVLLIGNLTRDPEVKYTSRGTALAEIGLAINRVYSRDDGEKKEEVTFVDVTLWGKQAKVAEQYLAKGRSCFIEGRLQLDTWDDRQTGQKRSRLRVIAENMQMLGGRSPNSSQPVAPAKSRPVRQAATAPANDEPGDDTPF